MIFGPKILTNQVADLNLKINMHEIPRTYSTKFLGVLIKDNLSWDLHIDCISTKISRILGILYKIKSKIPKKVLLEMYYSLIFPHLTYCNLLWGNSPDVHMKKLTICQNRFIRLMLELQPRSHVSSHYPTLQLLNMKNIHVYLIAIFVFKYLNNQLPKFYEDFFILSREVHQKMLRHTGHFYTCSTRLKLIQSSLKHTGPRVWDKIIPPEIKNTNLIHLFKNKVKKFLIMKNTIFL